MKAPLDEKIILTKKSYLTNIHHSPTSINLRSRCWQLLQHLGWLIRQKNSISIELPFYYLVDWLVCLREAFQLVDLYTFSLKKHPCLYEWTTRSVSHRHTYWMDHNRLDGDDHVIKRSLILLGVVWFHHVHPRDRVALNLLVLVAFLSLCLLRMK